MQEYRKLTEFEIQQLKEHACVATDWNDIEVVPDFKTDFIYYTRFSGKIKLGCFDYEFTLAGGIKKHAGL